MTPTAENMNSLNQQLRINEILLSQAEGRCWEMKEEISVMKSIIRHLLLARRRDMRWYNDVHWYGRRIDSNNYQQSFWREAEEITTLFNFVLATDVWRDAWAQESTQEFLRTWPTYRPTWRRDLEAAVIQHREETAEHETQPEPHQ